MVNRGTVFAIVGVVGKTFSTSGAQRPSPSLVVLANEVGEAITRQGHAVLTGGHVDRVETSVKYDALLGAFQAATLALPSRLIGILPASISKALGRSASEPYVDVDCKPAVRQLYVHTMLTSEARNDITGQTADVLIALEGGEGTASEVAVAMRAERPVVFLNSLAVLKPLVEANLKTTISSPLQANSPQDAVNKALSVIGWGTPALKLRGSCPILSEDFNNKLQQL